VCGGGLALDLNSKNGKQQHLHGGTCCVPEGAGDAVLVRNIGALLCRAQWTVAVQQQYTDSKAANSVNWRQQGAPFLYHQVL
jgi:hypothetical protein